MNHDNFKEVTSEDAKKMTNFPSSTAWANGYNTCLERTNAAELLDSLIKLTTDDHIEPEVWNRVIQEAKERIKKATYEK